MKTKTWIFKYRTPAGGDVYHKNNCNDILIIYSDVIKLFTIIQNNTSIGQGFYPCFAKNELIRKRK
jgi:hypothetical protein